MLRRVTSALFEEDEDASVSLAVQAQNNNGVESAIFDYDSTVLPAGPIQGHPGCTFNVLPAIHQFRTLVVFDPGAPPTARYDLFQVDTAGTLVPVGKGVTKAASAALIGFGIDGVAVAAPVAVGAPPAGRAGARRGRSSRSPQPPPLRKKAAARPTRKTAAKRKAATKAKRTPAKRKSTTGRSKTKRGKASSRKRR